VRISGRLEEFTGRYNRKIEESGVTRRINPEALWNTELGETQEPEYQIR